MEEENKEDGVMYWDTSMDTDEMTCEFTIEPEEWRDPVEERLKGVVQVSSHGNIRTFDRIVNKCDGTQQIVRGRVLTKAPDGRYKHVDTLDNKNEPISFQAHRLVAEVFVNNPDPENKTQVNHIDGNKNNNHPDNLEWVTCQENIQHAHDTGLHGVLEGEDAPQAKLTTEQVIEARRRSKAGEYQDSIARDFGVPRTVVCTAVNGRYYDDVDAIESPFRASDRRPHGFKHGCSKFTPEQVASIKQRVQQGESRASIAREYGVDRHTISDMCNGLTYKDDDSGITVTTNRPRYDRFNSPSCLIDRSEMPKIIAMKEQGMTLTEIGKLYNTDRHVVGRWLKWERELTEEEQQGEQNG